MCVNIISTCNNDFQFVQCFKNRRNKKEFKQKEYFQSLKYSFSKLRVRGDVHTRHYKYKQKLVRDSGEIGEFLA